MQSPPALEAKGIVKNYAGVPALKGVSFTVGRGEVFSLLGRNGAGKTTFIRIASTQLMPTGGTVTIGGIDVVKNPVAARQLIALVPQDARVVKTSSACEFVEWYLAMRGLSLSESHSRAVDAMATLGIAHLISAPCRTLSGGNRHKLFIACAIASGAPVIFLDEPTVGLDSQSRRQFWSTMLALRKLGRTIIMTTHYMEEAEMLSDRVAIIDGGVVFKIGTPSQIIAESGGGMRVDVPVAGIDLLKIPKGLARHDLGQKVRLVGSQKDVDEVASQALKLKIDVSVGRANLEDAFLNLVGGEK